MKLTSTILKKIVAEELAREGKGSFGKERDTEKVAGETDEVDPGDVADTLEKKIDYVKACKLKEAFLVSELAKIRESRIRVTRSLVS